jgi:hypothetical protein
VGRLVIGNSYVYSLHRNGVAHLWRPQVLSNPKTSKAFPIRARTGPTPHLQEDIRADVGNRWLVGSNGVSHIRRHHSIIYPHECSVSIPHFLRSTQTCQKRTSRRKKRKKKTRTVNIFSAYRQRQKKAIRIVRKKESAPYIPSHKTKFPSVLRVTVSTSHSRRPIQR